MMLHLIFLIFALVCFAIAALQPVSPNWNRLVAMGLAALAAAFLISAGGL